MDAKKHGSSEKAIFYFSKAIELQSSISEYTVNRAEVYWNYQKPNLALLDLDVAIGLGSAKALQLKREFQQEINIQLKSRNRYAKLLKEAGVDYLYHMTHLANLNGILEKGLLSHNKAHKKGLLAQDISDSTVNNRRVKIHNYVPLYFNPKNPMLYRRRNIQDELVILCIN
ncbi:MAG TPA: DarT ssDNA thymidine ADP-ribosyltransferase family protein, partial [Balneolales bacterium]|nr:DarT ssDNA thymidine ADP-ribosyltransferase family protein [Balneolales bacterium]